MNECLRVDLGRILPSHNPTILQRAASADGDDTKPEEDRAEDKWCAEQPSILGDQDGSGDERKDDDPEGYHVPARMKMFNRYQRPP